MVWVCTWYVYTYVLIPLTSGTDARRIRSIEEKEKRKMTVVNPGGLGTISLTQTTLYIPGTPPLYIFFSLYRPLLNFLHEPPHSFSKIL